jgi:hypothetical protein
LVIHIQVGDCPDGVGADSQQLYSSLTHSFHSLRGVSDVEVDHVGGGLRSVEPDAAKTLCEPTSSPVIVLESMDVMLKRIEPRCREVARLRLAL